MSKLPGHGLPMTLAVGEVARRSGVAVSTLHFYESKGLIDPQRAGANRVYTHRDRARLLLVLRGKRLGFSLACVKEYLDLYDAEPTHRTQLEHLLAGTRQRIGELELQHHDLELTLDELRDIERQTLEALHRAPQRSR